MKKGLNSIVFIIGFMAVLLIPILFYPVVKGRLDHNNYENRTLMTWDKVCKESDWKNLFPNLETFIEDNLLYKNECVGIIDRVDESVFHDLFNDSVMVGKEDWLFYKKDGCIQDYRGGFTMPQNELKEYSDAAVRLRDVLKKRDVELYLMITPNKESIYGERYLPDRVKRISDISRADQVKDYLENNTDCNIVYPENAIMEASYDNQVWMKYDTHWNEIGAFAGAQELLEAMGKDKTPISRVKVENGHEISGDLANMIGKGAVYSNDISYSIAGYKDKVNVDLVEIVQQSNLDFAKYESDSPDDRTVLFIGDSFLKNMEPCISKEFKTSLFVHISNYELLDRDLMETEKPDVVVLQSAERFINAYAHFMEMYAERFEE